jgi:hypothetical protein
MPIVAPIVQQVDNPIKYSERGKLMTKWLALTVVGILIISAAGFAYYHQKQSELREAYGNAVDAFSRVYEYRDSGVLLFEPRWKDFQTARDGFERKDGADGFVRAEWPKLTECGALLEQYRAYSEKESSAIENAHSIETLALVKQEVAEWDKSQAAIVQKANPCLKKPF